MYYVHLGQKLCEFQRSHQVRHTCTMYMCIEFFLILVHVDIPQIQCVIGVYILV